MLAKKTWRIVAIRQIRQIFLPAKVLFYMVVLNDVTNKSRVQRLITKEHIATHANLILLFKPALYSSILVIKLFKSSIKLFYAEIPTVAL